MADNTNNRLTTDGISHLWQRIKLLVTNSVSGKVDKVSGKGLSSNDYTNEEKQNLPELQPEHRRMCNRIGTLQQVMEPF